MRPAFGPLTARTLRLANAHAVNCERLGLPLPEGYALLARDYNSWRRRVARGVQADTPPIAPPRGAR